LSVCFIFSATVFSSVGARAQSDGSSYHLVKRLSTDHAGAALLALDPIRRRLYGAGNSVIDIDHDSVVGHLPSLGHGYALALDLGRGVTRRAAIFDLNTLAVIDSGIGHSETDVAYDRRSHRAFVVGDTTFVVDVGAARLIGRLTFGSQAMSAATDERGRVYIPMGNDSVVVLDAQSLHTVTRWGLGRCTGPRGEAFDAKNERLFVSCEDSVLAVLDTRNGRLVTTIPIPGPAWEIAFDRKLKLIYNPSGQGTIAVIHQDTPDTYRQLTPIGNADGESAVTLDPKTGRLFLLRKVPTEPVSILVFERSSH
jgi:DNA-binding beta-propeller fold protein YncE